MLELKLSKTNTIDGDGKRVYLSDDTGVYYKTTNPTGYGAPNLTRDQIAVFPIGYLNQAGGGKLPLDFEPFNPLLDSSWVALPKTDGWLSFNLVYVPVIQTPIVTDYQLGDFVFSIDDFTLFKVVEGYDTVLRIPTLEFKEAKTVDLLTNNSSTTYDQLFLANLSFQKINLNQRKIELLLDSENLSNTRKLNQIQEAYDRMRSVIQGAIYQFCIGNKYQAQRYVEFLLTNNYAEL
jgi:hypothetical protein